MNDGIYQGYSIYYHDLTIMSTESIMSMLHIYNIDSLEYLKLMQTADIIRN